MYATGGNGEAARLTGVNTNLVVISSLVACGVLSSFAGIRVTSKLANADPTLGPGYLLPAFTAVFLGSTQFKRGCFNVWGTVLSAYVLAAGVNGLQLSQAPVWIPDAFNGAALLVAVAAAKRQGVLDRSSTLARVLRKLRRTRPLRTFCLNRRDEALSPTDSDVARQVQILADRAAISDLLISFAYLDTKDWTAYAATYAPDGELAALAECRRHLPGRPQGLRRYGRLRGQGSGRGSPPTT